MSRDLDGLIKIRFASGENENVRVEVDITSYTGDSLSTFEVLGILNVAGYQTIVAKQEDAFYAHLPKPEGT